MFTASMLYDQIACSHKVIKDAFNDPAGQDNVSPFAQLLWDRGNIHEHELIKSLEINFLDLSDHPAEKRETLTHTAMSDQVTLIYGGRISFENLVGIARLLIEHGANTDGIDLDWIDDQEALVWMDEDG